MKFVYVCRKSVKDGHSAEPGSSCEMEKNLKTRLEISQMAPRPNYWSCLMAIDVIIADDYLILLYHLRGIREE